MTPVQQQPAPYQPARSLPARVKRKAVAAWTAKPARIHASRGCVSFTFDDAPASAIRLGASLLERAGLRATYYLSAGFTNGQTHLGAMHTADDIAHLRAHGHEIACHTFSHRDGARDPAPATLADIRRNAHALGDGMRNFAYPYGETHFALKRMLSDTFDTARGIQGGLNIGAVDLAQLKAQRLYGEDTWPAVEALLHAANARRGWAILFTHDVSETPTPYGCTPALLQRAIDLAHKLDLDIAPVCDVFAKVVRR